MVIHPSFDEAETFSQGLAQVRVGEKWGFINKSGSIAIEPAFDEVDRFTNGTAWIRSGEKVGYIDRTGKFLP